MVGEWEGEMFDTKKQLQWSKLKVGLVITVALLTLLITIFFAGNIEDLFLKKVELKAQIQDVKGLMCIP
jgi:ABC-type transporter Mla subunit MlaD